MIYDIWYMIYDIWYIMFLMLRWSWLFAWGDCFYLSCGPPACRSKAGRTARTKESHNPFRRNPRLGEGWSCEDMCRTCAFFGWPERWKTYSRTVQNGSESMFSNHSLQDGCSRKSATASKKIAFLRDQLGMGKEGGRYSRYLSSHVKSQLNERELEKLDIEYAKLLASQLKWQGVVLH